jgi:hypothetical protein
MVSQSAPALLDRDPPTPSMVSEISDAVRVAVPLVTSSATMPASPARSAGAAAAPARM